MEWISCFNLKPKQAGVFRQWLQDNKERVRNEAPAGWTYKGTFFTARGFGNHDCEICWQLENYAAFDAENPPSFNQVTQEFLEFVHDNRPCYGVLLKEADEVTIIE